MSKADKKIPLVECFGPTIQGEGAVIGQHTYFLRFGLCDFACKMCDSMHAVDPVQVKTNAQWLTQIEILERLGQQREPFSNSTNWVTFSGGNPCIHDLTLLCELLKSNNWNICVETQGTEAPKWLSLVDVISISPKGPGMGENTDLKQLDDFISSVASSHGLKNTYMKIVLFDARDVEFARMLFERYCVEKKLPLQMYLSLGNPYPPGFDKNITFETLTRELINNYKVLFEQIKNDTYLSKVRFLPQWHVFVWGNEKGK